jgi:hypothetical protein
MSLPHNLTPLAPPTPRVTCCTTAPPLQEAEAARQVGAMQASLERLQAEREALRREVAEAAGKRAEAEAQVSD